MSSNAAEWARVKALFDQALDQPAEQRDAWLALNCGGDAALLAELRSLLAARASADSGFLAANADRFAAALAAGSTETPGDVQIGDEVGPYKVLQILGQGGMGRVFLAERADGQFRQQVALKLIRAEFVTGELRERFLRERDILARLSHPNIAPLHDGGVNVHGVPYFTLEYIDGQPITRWCDERRLDIAARLRLLLKVCDAVQYAHRNLIVHRDLKPSNILVTAEGEPKLLDFGIAKPLDPTDGEQVTGTQSRPMTREYAAPEQVLGEPITTATDMYALGVLVYELLCGHLPYARASRGETSWPKAIVEEAPESLGRAISRGGGPADAEALAAARGQNVSMLRRSLRGDLDRIVRRALEKAPEARYPSVTALADDIRAHLEGRALPGGSRRYRLAKFLRRNRVAVGFAAVLSTVVIAGLMVIALQARSVAAHAQEALRQAQTTAAVKDFLLDLFHKADPNVAKGKEITARELIDRGVQRLDKIAPEQAALKAELQVTLGTIYFQLGLNKPAAELHEQAFNTLKSLGGDPILVVTDERNWATELVHLNKIPQARELADDALARLRALPDAPLSDRIRTLYTVGWIAQRELNAARAVQAATEAIALARQPPVDERLLGMALNLQGSSHWTGHDNDAAIASYREALGIHQRVLGADDLMTLADEEGIAASMLGSGRYVDAVEFFRSARDGYARTYGPHSMRALNATQGLALDEYESGHYADARGELEQVLVSLRDNPVQSNEFQSEVSINHGLISAELGDIDTGEKEISSARDVLSEKYGAKFNAVTEAVGDLGYVHLLGGKLETAEQELRQAIANKAEGKDDDIASELTWLSEVRRLRGDTDEANALAQRACDVALKIYGERSRQAARAHYALAQALLAAHKDETAQAQLRASLKSFALIVPPDGMHPFSAGPRLALGKMLAANPAQAKEASALLHAALKLRSETWGNAHPLTVEARDALAAVEAKH